MTVIQARRCRAKFESRRNYNQSFSMSSSEYAISLIAAGVAILVLTIYPFLRNSIDRGKQRRTMSHMRDIGGALDSYYLDFRTYPITESTVSELKKEMEEYLGVIPMEDDWGSKFRYQSNGMSYTIISLGKDRSLDGPRILPGLISNFSNDLVYSNGAFVCFPEGCRF